MYWIIHNVSPPKLALLHLLLAVALVAALPVGLLAGNGAVASGTAAATDTELVPVDIA